MKKRIKTLIEIRQQLSDLAFSAGSAAKLGKKTGLSHSNISKIIRGDGKPGKKIMDLLKIRPITGDKGKEPRYEDYTN